MSAPSNSDRCTAESESLGPCVLGAGHPGAHWTTARSVLVRVQPEILALMATGDVEPVVILGAREMPDGTHEMTFKRPDLVNENRALRRERDRLRAENEALKTAIHQHREKVLHGRGKLIDESAADEALWSLSPASDEQEAT